jgi:amino acid transporter
MAEVNGAPTLSRSLTAAEVVLLTLSALSPVASVYNSGGGILHLAGTGAVAACVVGGVVTALMALLFAELAAAFPDAGGLYAALEVALGPRFSLPYIGIFIIITPVSNAFTSLGMAYYLRVLIPGLPLLATCFACIVASGVIAAMRVRTGALITGTFMAVEAVVMAVLVGVAVLHQATGLGTALAHPVYLAGGALRPVPAVPLGLAIVSAIYTCSGASWALYFGGELKDAQRRIGRVVAVSGFIASATIAAPLILVTLGMGDLGALLGQEAPIAAFIAATAGAGVAALIAAGVVAALFNNLIAANMALARFLYASGRDGYWPRTVNAGLARLNPRRQTPVVATVVACVLCALCCLLSERTLLILSSATFIDMLLMAAAILVGRRHGRTGRFFKVPLHPLVPVIGLLVGAACVAADWMDADTGRPSMVLIAAVYVAGMWYFPWRKNGRLKGSSRLR